MEKEKMIKIIQETIVSLDKEFLLPDLFDSVGFNKRDFEKVKRLPKYSNTIFPEPNSRENISKIQFIFFYSDISSCLKKLFKIIEKKYENAFKNPLIMAALVAVVYKTVHAFDNVDREIYTKTIFEFFKTIYNRKNPRRRIFWNYHGEKVFQFENEIFKITNWSPCDCLTDPNDPC